MESPDSEWTTVEKKFRVPKQPESGLNASTTKSSPVPYTPPFRTQGGYSHHSSGSIDTNRNYNNNRGGSSSFRGGRGFGRGDRFHNRDNKKYEPMVAFASPEEEAKFTKLQLEIPHLMMPGHIRKIQRKINIDQLAERMLSDDWIDYQRQGWVYDRVIKPDDTTGIPDGEEWSIRELENKWGDIILFKRADSL